MLAVVTGIPGTGKTTVATAALEKLKGEGVGYKLVTYGDVMFEIAKSKGAVSDRDDMRKISPAVQRDIQKSAAKKIASMASGGNVLLDTHCTISTPKGYLPGLPEWVLEELMPDYFILVEANPADINKRRNADKSRNRDDEGVAGIALHQEMNRNIAMAYSMMTGCIVKVIGNKQGQIDASAQKMAEVLR